MSLFENDTAVEKTGDGRYRATIDTGWSIGGNPNGGYLLSLVTSAIRDVVDHPDPLSITTHYLRPGAPGLACEIEVEVVRVGRTLSTVRARLVQENKTRIEVIAAYGDLSVPVGVDADISIPRPAMPAVEECVPRTGQLQNIEIEMLHKLDVMLHPAQSRPGESDLAQLSGYIRFSDEHEPDTRALLLFCDTFPPAPISKLGILGWVPTIELTVHVRRRPAPGWVLGQFTTDDLNDGRMIETGCLWDSEAKLVAQSRQIGLVMNRE